MAGSGAIGAACEVPETAANSTVATAMAKTVRIIFILLEARTGAILITPQYDGSSATAKAPRNEQTVRILNSIEPEQRLGIVAADLDPIMLGDLGGIEPIRRLRVILERIIDGKQHAVGTDRENGMD